MNARMALIAVLLFPPALVVQDKAPSQPRAFRAMYDWGFASPSGEGKGTLAVLVDCSNGKTVLELHTLGERLMLLQGDAESGYRLLIPRNDIDESAPELRGLPVPFLPALDDPGDLARLFLEGAGQGIKASRRDSKGPKRLRWDGRDEKEEPCTIWLKRTKYEGLPTTAE